MDKRREIYDALCRTLTDYEEGAAGGRDLYRMLCEIQRRWEDTITVQDLTCGWSHHENVLKDPADILNTFRNRYYADGCSTENGIVAIAINDILPRMILPPCKVGDTVYYINTLYFTPLERNKVYRAEVTRIVTTKRGVSFVAKVRYAGGVSEIAEDGFGKTVFLTREEAERALKGGEQE